MHTLKFTSLSVICLGVFLSLTSVAFGHAAWHQESEALHQILPCFVGGIHTAAVVPALPETGYHSNTASLAQSVFFNSELASNRGYHQAHEISGPVIPHLEIDQPGYYTHLFLFTLF